MFFSPLPLSLVHSNVGLRTVLGASTWRRSCRVRVILDDFVLPWYLLIVLSRGLGIRGFQYGGGRGQEEAQASYAFHAQRLLGCASLAASVCCSWLFVCVWNSTLARSRLKKLLNEADIEADDGSLKPRPSASATPPSTAAAACPVGMYSIAQLSRMSCKIVRNSRR